MLFFFRFSKQTNITSYFTEDRTTENQTKPQFSLRSNFHREREREITSKGEEESLRKQRLGFPKALAKTQS